MQSNYAVMEDQARMLFCRYDLSKIAARWNLAGDEEYVYIPYFGKQYRIRRSDGKVLSPADAPVPLREGTFGASLTIYDVLTYSKENPGLSGSWESLSTLGGIIGAGHEYSLTGDPMHHNLRTDLQYMKGVLLEMGSIHMEQTSADLDYVVPVFPFLPMRFQFWAADDEFPASVKYLWDRNTLRFMHYETLWYAMGDFDQWLNIK